MPKPPTRKILGYSDSKSIFVDDEEEPFFFRLMLNYAAVSRPVVCYIGAAKRDEAERIKEFKSLCQRSGCEPKILSVFDMESDDPETYFENVDAIYIDGGVTRNLMALMHEWDIISALKKAYESGVLISGASAGIIMFFEWFVTDSIKSDLRIMPGIGLLKGSLGVHFDVQKDRGPMLERALQDGTITSPVYGLDEGVAILYVEGELSRIHSLNADRHFHEFTEGVGWSKILLPHHEDC